VNESFGSRPTSSLIGAVSVRAKDTDGERVIQGTDLLVAK
jgi:hypothetical protein